MAGPGTPRKLRAATLVSLVGELERRGFTFTFQKYTQLRNKWMLTLTCPAGAKANFAIPIASNKESVDIMNGLNAGGARFLFNLSGAVGRFGEAAFVRKFRSGTWDMLFTSKGGSWNLKDMTIGTAMPLQNRSGQGLDWFAKITAPRPPAPLWVAAEVKSKMGPGTNFPPLSAAQQRPDYLQNRIRVAQNGIEKAERGTGTTWADMVPFADEIEDFATEVGKGNVLKLIARVELDKRGQQVGDIQISNW